MVVGFDGLVERLLYDVALAGTGGEFILQCAAHNCHYNALQSSESIEHILTENRTRDQATW